MYFNIKTDVAQNLINDFLSNFVCQMIFKPLSYCFEETIEFDVKASCASRPLSRLIS